MKRTGRGSAWSLTASLGRSAIVVLTVGGLSPLAFASSAASAATRPATASVVSSAMNPKLGAILAAGDTVYILKTRGTPCTATCLKVRPPVLLPHGVKTAAAGSGVDASKLGTAAAAHGALQVTYSGKRLYWSAKDTAPGQVRGSVKDKWGQWSTVTAMASSDTSNPNAGATTTNPTTPQTVAPDTAPADTSPPETATPTTSPPAPQPTEPPPPPTKPPGTGGVAF